MVRRRIPLWVAPVVLLLLFGACNSARGNRYKAETDMCGRAYYAMGGSVHPKVQKVRRQSGGVIILSGRVPEGIFTCRTTVDYDGVRSVNDFAVY